MPGIIAHLLGFKIEKKKVPFLTTLLVIFFFIGLIVWVIPAISPCKAIAHLPRHKTWKLLHLSTEILNCLTKNKII